MLPLANWLGFGNPSELLIIAGVVVLLFGGSKIATFGKQLGEGTKEFKKAIRDAHEDGDAQPSAPRVMETAPIDAAPVVGGGPHTSEATTVSSAAPSVKE